MRVDPVTGAVPVKFGDEIIELRFTNSAYAYVEDEANVEAAHDAILRFVQTAETGRVPFSLVIAFGRAFLRAAKKDPDLVDVASREDLVTAVGALVISTLVESDAPANPPKAAAV